MSLTMIFEKVRATFMFVVSPAPAALLETVNWHSRTVLKGGLNVNNHHYPSL